MVQGEEYWAYIPNAPLLRPLTWMDKPPEIFHSVEIKNPAFTVPPGPHIFMHLQERANVNITSHFVYPPLLQPNYAKTNPCMSAVNQV